MNTNQYTQKTLEALQAAQQLAVEYQHNALEPAHLLHALAAQENGLIPQYELHQCGIACHACGCQSGNGQSECHPPIDITHEFGKHGSLFRLFRVISIYVFSFHYVVVFESRVIY